MYMKEYQNPYGNLVSWKPQTIQRNKKDVEIQVGDFGSQVMLQGRDQGDNKLWGTYDSDTAVYNTYAGTDIVAEILLPTNETLTLGELQTISYSTHRENTPVRALGHVSPIGFVKGPRTIAGSLIFTVFNYYAFYRLEQFKEAVVGGIYPQADMLPPFDVIITFSNEIGAMSKMKLYGVTVIDEGQTMSVDDLITEQTYSYMARGIQPMTAFVLNEAAPTTRTGSGVISPNGMDFNN
jgi:hypothetical protein